ncbi:FUSC family protein [Acetobacter lambici]|uniref:FUSC family protein n=1 Tax=Acetobacter lambici TaxID=1332824 RepID=A0ABT1F1Q7_9PROT|nr:FUSC family protein [Acetobacter lambici]MCP1242978.1 FUSC family protein [Acetobacter lambici]MCP1259152.1 FUSC family protein [Acetobacter lambici]NHO57354.1 FUSC family protein [Acetobacter lambici]
MPTRSDLSALPGPFLQWVNNRVAPALFADDARWNGFVATAGYTMRVFLSIGIALFLAFVFQLQSPLSAATTVLIVSNPTVGAMVSKSVWRIVGTLIGAAISVGVMAVFVQSPVLYFAVLSVFVGLACMVATFLRFFRAYAAVLTGYTIVIIAAPAFANPDGIFLSAMSRLSVVATGIVVTACVFMVTSPRRPSTVLHKLGQAFRDTVLHARTFHKAESERATPEALDATVTSTLEKQEQKAQSANAAFRGFGSPIYDSRSKLLANMSGLTPAIEFAAADDPDMQNRVRNLRLCLSRLTGLIVSYHPYWLTFSSGVEETRAVHLLVAQTLGQILELTEHPDWLTNATPLSTCLHDALKTLEQLARQTTSTTTLAALDNTRDALVQMDLALHDLTSLRPDRTQANIQPYLEWPTALRNGVRGGFIALLAGMLWYVLHWSAGPLLIIYTVAASSLLSTTPSAAKASPMMATGTVLAIPMGFLCHALALPRIDGYPLLWLSLCLFLLPGVWLQFHPRYSIGAFGYAVFFTMMLSVDNPIVYDDLTLTNNWMSMLAACALLAIVFRVILPADHRLDAARLVTSLTRSLQKLARTPYGRTEPWVAWEGMQLQKISRLMMRLSFITTSVDRQGYTDAAFASLSLGRLIVRLKWNAAHATLDPQAHAALANAFNAFAQLRHNPAATALALRHAAQAIRTIPTQEAGLSLTRDRTLSCLEQAANIILSVPGFFHDHGPIQLPEDLARPMVPVSVHPATQ